MLSTNPRDPPPPSLLSDNKEPTEITINTSELRTIYENYVNNSVWFSTSAVHVADVPSYSLYWKRWWLHPFREIPRAISRLSSYPSSSVFLLVVFTLFMWVLLGIVSGVAFVFHIFQSILSAFPFLGFFKIGSAVNWGSLRDLETWKMETGDLTNSEWDIKNCRFFIRACSLAYEDPDSVFFDKIGKGWGFNFTRTAARDSAIAHVWKFIQGRSGIVILMFKGTSPFNWNEWLTDATASPVLAQQIVGNNFEQATVHQGFYEALWGENSLHWLHICHQLNSTCKEFPKEIEKIHIWVTGHSLGAATATLATCRLLLHQGDIRDPRAELRGSYTFGTPRVGDRVFIDIVTETLASRKNCRMHRVVNGNDIITMIPFEDPEGTYLHFGECHYLSLKGVVTHHGDKVNNPWKEFLMVRGGNLGWTIVEQVKTLLTLYRQIGILPMYNVVSRLFIPFFLYDHYPSQYEKHLVVDTPYFPGKQLNQTNK